MCNLHRLDAEEMWHFYAGDPLTVHMIDAAGDYSTLSIGADVEAGQQFQAAAPPDIWFGSTVDVGGGFALVGCTVSPGFESSGFELAERTPMLERFPQHAEIMKGVAA